MNEQVNKNIYLKNIYDVGLHISEKKMGNKS